MHVFFLVHLTRSLALKENFMNLVCNNNSLFLDSERSIRNLKKLHFFPLVRVCQFVCNFCQNCYTLVTEKNTGCYFLGCTFKPGFREGFFGRNFELNFGPSCSSKCEESTSAGAGCLRSTIFKGNYI